MRYKRLAITIKKVQKKASQRMPITATDNKIKI